MRASKMRMTCSQISKQGSSGYADELNARGGRREPTARAGRNCTGVFASRAAAARRAGGAAATAKQPGSVLRQGRRVLPHLGGQSAADIALLRHLLGMGEGTQDALLLSEH